jgi:hypothetical protein
VCFPHKAHILLVVHHGEHELAQEKKPALQMCLRADSQLARTVSMEVTGADGEAFT